MNFSYVQKNAGFTLLEMLLSVAAIGIIIMIGVPVYQSLQVRNDLDVGATTIAQMSRRAEVLSQTAQGDSNWGVKIQSGSIVIFKGTSYSGRDTSYDEIISLPTSITPTGVSEIVFDKVTGFPQTTGTTTLTSTSNEVKNININAKGTISY